ncbi:hypothetical protein [Crenothrix polyspora]|uniref:Uncharacterized protein n=1 Tax=Crenothrix polyspora TaxID=360316 RepID=A0A1R4GZL4_9GAMM|nr:hypothetical protein [Crenothrix polyspora]SJM89416.1 conserved exported hypothetical protein [Crenothrix polyspora]
MIKPIISMSIVLLTGMMSETMAACATDSANSQYTQVIGAAALSSLLSGRTVCAMANGEQWQEYHSPSADLIDYKKGPNDPVDPSELVGTWTTVGSTAANSKAIYDYDASTFSYKVWQNGTPPNATYDFCNATTIITNAQLVTGSNGCP